MISDFDKFTEVPYTLDTHDTHPVTLLFFGVDPIP